LEPVLNIHTTLYPIFTPNFYFSPFKSEPRPPIKLFLDLKNTGGRGTKICFPCTPTKNKRKVSNNHDFYNRAGSILKGSLCPSLNFVSYFSQCTYKHLLNLLHFSVLRVLIHSRYCQPVHAANRISNILFLRILPPTFRLDCTNTHTHTHVYRYINIYTNSHQTFLN
jgi:hypothetical protein